MSEQKGDELEDMDKQTDKVLELLDTSMNVIKGQKSRILTLRKEKAELMQKKKAQEARLKQEMIRKENLRVLDRLKEQTQTAITLFQKNKRQRVVQNLKKVMDLLTTTKQMI